VARLLRGKELVVDLQGRIGTSVVAAYRRKNRMARKRYKDLKESGSQANVRGIYSSVDKVWIGLKQPKRNEWRSGPWRRGWSNYARFMSVNLKRKFAGKDVIVDNPWYKT